MIVHGYTAFGMIDATLDGVRMTIPDDMANRHRQMIAEWEKAGNEIPAFEPPPPPVPAEISDRQFFHVLAKRGLITQQEALSAVKTGDMPQALENMILSLPEEQRFDARILLEGAVTFRRDHPLTLAFGATFGMTSAQIDDLWTEASQL